MAFSDVIARLAVSMSLDTAAFETGSRRAKKEASGFQGHMSRVAKAVGGALAGMATFEVVQQLRDMTKAAIDSAGALGEQAAQIGISTKALQEYRFAATQVGLSQEEMELGLAQLTRRLGDAAQGVKEPIAALDRLGISVDSLAGLDAGDVIPKIAEGLMRIEDPGQRAAIAVDLFGKSGQKLMPLLEGGAAGVEAFRQQAEKLGLVLSEGEIAKADEVADKLAALNYQIEAQQNRKLLENADAVIAYEQAIGNLKLALITGIGDIEAANQRYNAWALSFNKRMRDLAASVPAFLRQMVDDIRAQIVGRLNGIWNAVTQKVDVVRQSFFDLWDKVTRRSYVPDMVDDIAREMARLDGVMVEPASAATAAATASFRKMDTEVRGLMDRLFPEIARARDFAADAAAIARSGLPVDVQAEARRRLYREDAGLLVSGRDEVPLDLDVAKYAAPIDGMSAAAEKLMDRLAGLKASAGETSVRVVESFKDMADKTLQSFDRLVGAIRGGGFLDILSAVVGLGLQLGGAGLFGSRIAARINSSSRVPGRASGGPVMAGKPYLVGELGPELVVPRHSATVVPNHALGRGGGDRYYFNGNLMTPEFWERIQRGDALAAQSGAQMANQQQVFQRSRLLTG